MLSQYMQAALRRARYKLLDDGSWYAEIPDFRGVWANAADVETCRGELAEVLEEWLLLKIHDGDDLPVVDGLKIAFVEEAVA